jgi:hypothetical protein
MEEQRERSHSKDELPISHVGDDIWKIILERQRLASDLINLYSGIVGIPDIDKNGKAYIRYERVGKPRMNEKGIQFFKPIIYSAMTPDKLVTNITDEEVKAMMKEFMYAFIDTIVEKREEFEIDPSDMSMLSVNTDHFYFLALSGSRRGTLLAVLKPTFKREETYTPQKSEKTGLLSHMPTFLGGNK